MKWGFGATPDVVAKLKETGLRQLTETQARAAEAGLCRGVNLVISAPTSSGKTTIAEIAAIEGALHGQKTVYLVTHRALAEEKYLRFTKDYSTKPDKWFETTISTGDHTEGDWTSGILVATYEKFLSLLTTSEAYAIQGKIVVADEIQIIGDPTRGPDIEVLCTLIRNQVPAQFIGLSATLPNAREIADWLNCDPVIVDHRDVPLRQEVWTDTHRYFNFWGNDEVHLDENANNHDTDTLGVVRHLLAEDAGPILVFTMTRPRAVELAQRFAAERQQDVKSFALATQLDLFSEPTTIASILREISERKVAFHSADLSFSERHVIEEALRANRLDVVFCTPTLAAGVNFPVKTVVFDSFARHWIREQPWLPKQEYSNMSGRAGRLGYHDEGRAILLARDRAELIKSREYLLPDEDRLSSALFSRGIRKAVLNLVASSVASTNQDLLTFYESSFGWHQLLERNPAKLDTIPRAIEEATAWLEDNALVTIEGKRLFATRIGKAISASGLLPSTAIFLVGLIKKNQQRIIDDAAFELPILLAAVSSDEFHEDLGQRFLPYASRGAPEPEAWRAAIGCEPFFDPVGANNYDRVANAAFALHLWIGGMPERQLRHKMERISYGQLHALASDSSWILEGVAEVLRVPELGIDGTVTSRLSLLTGRTRHGVPSDVLDLMYAARTFSVPGFERQRAMAVHEEGLSDPNDLISSPVERVSEIVGGRRRAEALIHAVGEVHGRFLEVWKGRHLRRGRQQPDRGRLIEESYNATGIQYELAIEEMLKSLDWSVEKLDDGKRQGMPDFLLGWTGRSIVIECKTKQNTEALINKDDAFAVFAKSVDINADHRLTIGKPDFSSFCREKAAGARNVTLVPHKCFVEAILRAWEGTLSTDALFNWLLKPGVAEIGP